MTAFAHCLWYWTLYLAARGVSEPVRVWLFCFSEWAV